MLIELVLFPYISSKDRDAFIQSMTKESLEILTLPPQDGDEEDDDDNHLDIFDGVGLVKQKQKQQRKQQQQQQQQQNKKFELYYRFSCGNIIESSKIQAYPDFEDQIPIWCRPQQYRPEEPIWGSFKAVLSKVKSLQPIFTSAKIRELKKMQKLISNYESFDGSRTLYQHHEHYNDFIGADPDEDDGGFWGGLTFLQRESLLRRIRRIHEQSRFGNDKYDSRSKDQILLRHTFLTLLEQNFMHEFQQLLQQFPDIPQLRIAAGPEGQVSSWPFQCRISTLEHGQDENKIHLRVEGDLLLKRASYSISWEKASGPILFHHHLLINGAERELLFLSEKTVISVNRNLQDLVSSMESPDKVEWPLDGSIKGPLHRAERGLFISPHKKDITDHIKSSSIQVHLKKYAEFMQLRMEGLKRIDIPAEQTEFIVNMTSSGGLQTLYILKMEDQREVRIKNFIPAWAHKIILGHFAGIRAFSDDPDDLLSRRTGAKAYDRKTIKHQGLYNQFIINCLCFYLEQRDMQGNEYVSAKGFWKRLDLILQNHIKEFFTTSPKSAMSTVKKTRIISKKILAFFEQIFYDIQKQGVETVCLDTMGAEIHFQPNYQQVLYRYLLQLFLSFYRKDNIKFMKSYRKTVSNFGISFQDSFNDARTSNPGLDFSVSLATDPHFPVEEAKLLDSTLRNELFTFAMIGLEEGGIRTFLLGRSCAQIEDSQLQTSWKIDEGPRPSAEVGREGPIDWFELHPQVFLYGRPLELQQADQLFTEGLLCYQGKYYLLNEKKMPTINQLQKLWASLVGTTLKKESGEKRIVVPLPKNRILELLSLKVLGAEVDGGPFWDAVWNFFQSLNDGHAHSLKIPSSFRGKLRPFQYQGVNWLYQLYKLRLGAILADEMGLGKTVQTIAFLDILWARREMERVLILVPTSLVYNWTHEFLRFTPHVKVQVFDPKQKESWFEDVGEKKSPGITICTYGLFSHHASLFRRVHFHLIILDEGHFIKNFHSQRTKELRPLQADFKLALTGTPLENHYGELFSLVDFILPGSLGELKYFNKEFVYPKVVNPEALKYLQKKIAANHFEKNQVLGTPGAPPKKGRKGSSRL